MANGTFRKGAKTPLSKSPSASAASRVKDLLARMTLEEKAAQMICVWQE
jgi:beta-glucosidase